MSIPFVQPRSVLVTGCSSGIGAATADPAPRRRLAGVPHRPPAEPISTRSATQGFEPVAWISPMPPPWRRPQPPCSGPDRRRPGRAGQQRRLLPGRRPRRCFPRHPARPVRDQRLRRAPVDPRPAAGLPPAGLRPHRQHQFRVRPHHRADGRQLLRLQVRPGGALRRPAHRTARHRHLGGPHRARCHCFPFPEKRRRCAGPRHRPLRVRLWRYLRPRNRAPPPPGQETRLLHPAAGRSGPQNSPRAGIPPPPAALPRHPGGLFSTELAVRFIPQAWTDPLLARRVPGRRPRPEAAP
jgi:hypothetical protein